jgi:DeoR/GlpR family transcriptional regulator of sugar metabolism
LNWQKHCQPELSATFITGSLPVAYEYVHHPNIEVIFIGDKILKSAQISVGGEAISRIKQIKADLCFIGTNAIDTTHGLTDNDWEVVQVKKAMIESSEKCVSMVISEKLNTNQRIKVCDLSEIDFLVTELKPDHQQLEPYRQAGVCII